MADAPLSYQDFEARARELSRSTFLLKARLRTDGGADPQLAPEGTALAVVVLDSNGQARLLTSGPLVAGSASLRLIGTGAEAGPDAWRPLGDGALVALDQLVAGLVAREVAAPALQRTRASVSAPMLGEQDAGEQDAGEQDAGDGAVRLDDGTKGVEYGAVSPAAPRRVFVLVPNEPGAGLESMAPALVEAVLTPALDLPVTGLAVVTPRLPLGCPLFDEDGRVAGVVFRWHDAPDRVWAVTGAWIRDALRPEGPPWDPPPPPPRPAPGLRGARGRR